MSDYYNDVYRKRLNRYGLDYQSRIQGQREKEFDKYLYKSIYRVDFLYQEEYHPATLEPYKQSYSETQSYLLTKRDLKIPNGTVLTIDSLDGASAPWMVWWLEQVESGGYNRYIVLKMTHLLNWDFDGEKQEQWAYFLGPGTSVISETVATATGKAVYKENDRLHMFITPYTSKIKNGAYFELNYQNEIQAFKASESDINSTPGVSYVTIDPVLIRDKSEKIEPEETNQQSFWLAGGFGRDA